MQACPACGKMDGTSATDAAQGQAFAAAQAEGATAFPQTAPKNDTPDIWIPILAFFIPVVGLILYLVWKDDKPQSSSAAGKFALIGFIVEVVIGILIFCSIIFLISMSTI